VTTVLFSGSLARYNSVHVYPRPAKLLFQIDDGWGKLLTQYGDAIPEWTQLVVERMLA